jgi:ABC-2 type transport system permease protein
VILLLKLFNIFTYPISLPGVLISIVFVLLGLGINFLLDMLIGLAAFWFDKVWFLFIVKELFLWILAGKLLPLDFLPEAAGNILQLLPFKYLGYYPTVLVMGKVDFVFSELGIALLWLTGLFILVQVIWKKGVKGYAGYGW